MEALLLLLLLLLLIKCGGLYTCIRYRIFSLFNTFLGIIYFPRAKILQFYSEYFGPQVPRLNTGSRWLTRRTARKKKTLQKLINLYTV